MLRAIIADDEEKICVLIQKLVDWDTLNIRVLGTANNGQDAFRMIEQLRPDIVITDIRMPGMDGLEMVQKAKEQGIPASFVVISGYKQFEYAHQALKFGVEDYLLKPIKKEELTATLKKISMQKQAGGQAAAPTIGAEEGEAGEELFSFNRVSLDDYCTPRWTKQLTHAVASLSETLTQRMIAETFAWVSMQPNVSPVAYFDAAKKLVAVIGEALVRGGLRQTVPGMEQIPGMEAANGADTLRKKLMEWAEDEMRRPQGECVSQEHLSIRQARQYIGEHFTEPITLEEVAGAVHLNPYYFSAVFKREQGTNFNRYVMELRVEAAKSLLRESSLSMSQVAEQVGYRDTKYFRKVFLQEVGIRPSEYRKLYT